jgi:PAS domain S-box-containing protein
LKEQEQRVLPGPAAEQKYQRLFEMAEDGIFLLDAATGVVSDANPVVEEMLGYSPAELIGTKLWESGPFRRVSASQTASLKLQKKSYFHYEDLPLETKDGQLRNVDFISNVYQVGSRKIIQCNIRDITEHRQAEQEIRQRADEMTVLNILGSQINQSLSLDEVVEHAIRETYKAVQPGVAFLFLRENEQLILKGFAPASGKDIFDGAPDHRVGECMCGLAFLERAPLYSKNIFNDTRCTWVECKKAGLVSFAALPLLNGEDVIGVIGLGERTERDFEKQAKFLETIASQVSIGVRNALLYETIQLELTERKRAEKNVKISEARYRSLVETQAEVISRSDLLGNLLFVNDSYCRTFGIQREQVIGTHFIPTVFSEDLPVVNEMQAAIKQPPYRKYIEIRNMTPGGVRWFGWDNSAVRNEQGDIIELQGVGRDITERKQAEEALRESENLMRESQVSAGLGSYVLDISSGLWKSSDMLDQVFGIDAAYERSVDGWAALTHPDDRKMMVDYFTNDVLGQGKPFDKEYRIIRHSDQAERRVHGLGRLEFDGRGQPVKMHGTIQDITERKQAEIALRKSEERFRKAFMISPDAININRLQDGMYIAINNGFTQIMGFTEADCIGNTSVELNIWVDPQDRKRLVDGLVKNGEVNNLEARFCAKNGDIKYGLMSASVLELNNIPHIISITRDITERKRAEDVLAQQAEELRRRNDELARLYRASGSLISGASLSLQELAQSIVAVVQQEFGQANCSLMVVSRNSNELVCLATAGPYSGQVKYSPMSLDGPGLATRSIRMREVVNVRDVRLEPDYVQGWEAARSELVIPLMVENTVIGVFDVQSSQPDSFSLDDERLMSIFAERAALVLEHSRLNAQTETHMQQLLALRTIDMAISSSFDLSMTLGVLLDQITRLLGIHAVDILAFNAFTQTFKLSCEKGFRNHSLHHLQIKFGSGYAWSLVRERQRIVVPDLRAEEDGLQRTPDLSGEQFITYVGIPLLAKGQVKGVLEVFQREPLVLAPEGYAFLEMLAGQAAIAIDNSELFEHLQSSNAELGMAYDSTLEGWANALELRDKETEGHTRRVAELSTRLAQTMGVRDNDILQVYRGALLHDIGKMGVPDSIVLKPGPLTEEEWAVMRKHPQYAYDMLSPINYLRQALDIPHCHHEKWDGMGYPRGLRGTQIPMAARIFAVVDVWDAITSDRPYRKAWQKEVAVQYIQEQSGHHFDPEVVKAFLAPNFNRD